MPLTPSDGSYWLAISACQWSAVPSSMSSRFIVQCLQYVAVAVTSLCVACWLEEWWQEATYT
jgi:hypothetical protein